MIVMVCGMTCADNIKEVEQAGATLIGFDFVAGSPRAVAMVPSQAGIMPDYSVERLDELRFGHADAVGAGGGADGCAGRVGVFADDMVQNIVTRVYNHRLDYVLLHGNEPRTTCENLRSTLVPDIRPGIRIMKTIRVTSAADVCRWRHYRGAADMLVFHLQPGGGTADDRDACLMWMRQYDGDIPFLLSGNIGPDDAARVRSFSHPRCVGVCVDEQFDAAPGVKDAGGLKAFIDALRG